MGHNDGIEQSLYNELLCAADGPDDAADADTDAYAWLAMTKYYWDGSDWVEKKPVHRVNGPYIWNDLPPYVSPMGTGVIDGRTARREDLKRHGCREVDPSEWKPDPKSSRQADAERLQLAQREPYAMPPDIRERLMRGR